MARTLADMVEAPAPDTLANLNVEDFIQRVRRFNGATKRYVSDAMVGLHGADNPAFSSLTGYGQSLDDILKPMFPMDYVDDDDDGPDEEFIDNLAEVIASILGKTTEQVLDESGINRLRAERAINVTT